MSPLMKVLIEAGPLVVFFAANAKLGVFWGTGLFMAATVIALAFSYYKTRHLPMMPLFSAVIVLIFGGLTLYLHDEFFIKIKPTLIYMMFAGLMAGGLAIGRNFLKLTMEAALPPMAEQGWTKMTLRWSVFFVFMAVLNEIVWRNFSTDTWISFKLFGAMPLVFLFSLAQAPLISKYEIPEEQAKAEAADEPL